MGISRVYLDSYYVLEMVNKNKSHRDVQKLMYRLKQPAFEVLVSQTVLGEVVAKILPKPAQERADALSRLPKILQDHGIDPSACLTPPPSAAFKIMKRLHDNDPYLEATDIMIMSHVLADPNSKFFFTNDAVARNWRLLASQIFVKALFQARNARNFWSLSVSRRDLHTTNDAKLLKSRQIKECERQLRDDGKRAVELVVSGGL